MAERGVSQKETPSGQRKPSSSLRGGRRAGGELPVSESAVNPRWLGAPALDEYPGSQDLGTARFWGLWVPQTRGSVLALPCSPLPLLGLSFPEVVPEPPLDFLLLESHGTMGAFTPTVFEDEFGTLSGPQTGKRGVSWTRGRAAPGDLSRARAGASGLERSARWPVLPEQESRGSGPSWNRRRACLFSLSSPRQRLIDHRTVSMARVQ